MMTNAREFQLKPGGPGEKFVVWFVLGAALTAQAANLALLVTDTVSLDASLAGGAFLLLAPVLVYWNMRRLGTGAAHLDEAGLTVTTRGATHYYRWSDISSAEVRPFAPRLFGRVARKPVGAEREASTVQLNLRRSLRLSPFRARHGTGIFGIPSVVLRTAAICVEDPEGFADAINSHVQRQS